MTDRPSKPRSSATHCLPCASPRTFLAGLALGLALFTGSALTESLVPSAHAEEAAASGPLDLSTAPSASELLASMDDNLQFETRSATVSMVVNDGRRTREYKMISYGRGQDDAAMEYLAPEREKGTRMLKLGDQLWLYMPRAERTQKISGHMLRQGMMGSDVSYEDMMAGSEFEEMYDAEVVGSDLIDARPHWKIEAKAKDTTVSYPRRLIWVDAEHKIPTKQELYALSGMLMKTWTMSDLEEVEGRITPMRMEIRDVLKEGSSTLLITEELSFGVELEDETFSKRWLERK